MCWIGSGPKNLIETSLLFTPSLWWSIKLKPSDLILVWLNAAFKIIAFFFHVSAISLLYPTEKTKLQSQCLFTDSPFCRVWVGSYLHFFKLVHYTGQVLHRFHQGLQLSKGHLPFTEYSNTSGLCHFCIEVCVKTKNKWPHLVFKPQMSSALFCRQLPMSLKTVFSFLRSSLSGNFFSAASSISLSRSSMSEIIQAFYWISIIYQVKSLFPPNKRQKSVTFIESNNSEFWPILLPSSCSRASFTLLAQESKDSDLTFNRCNMANSSSRVYLYLRAEWKNEYGLSWCRNANERSKIQTNTWGRVFQWGSCTSPEYGRDTRAARGSSSRPEQRESMWSYIYHTVSHHQAAAQKPPALPL